MIDCSSIYSQPYSDQFYFFPIFTPLMWFFFFQCGILTCYHFLNKLWLFSFYSLLGCFNWKLFFLWKHPYCPSFFNRSKAFRTHSFSFTGPREETNLFLGQHCCFQIIVYPLSLDNLMSSEIFAIKVVHWTSWQCTDLLEIIFGTWLYFALYFCQLFWEYFFEDLSKM